MLTPPTRICSLELHVYDLSAVPFRWPGLALESGARGAGGDWESFFQAVPFFPVSVNQIVAQIPKNTAAKIFLPLSQIIK